jgi:cytochrome b561
LKLERRVHRAAWSAYRLVCHARFSLGGFKPLSSCPIRLDHDNIHGYAMWVLLALVVVHAGAALYHHFIRHDNVLRRMLFNGRGVS